LDQRADIEADDEAKGDGGEEERDDDGADLAVPLLHVAVASGYGGGVEGRDAGADVVHQKLALIVEGDVVSPAAGLDGGDEGTGKALLPGIVGAAEGVEGLLALGIGG